MTVRRQNIWDRWGPDLKESWPHLGLIFRLRFFGFACADVRDRAVRGRDMVAATMTPAQIAEAQRLASEWKPKR